MNHDYLYRPDFSPFEFLYPIAYFWVPLVVILLPVAALILVGWMIWVFFLREG